MMQIFTETKISASKGASPVNPVILAELRCLHEHDNINNTNLHHQNYG